MSRQLQRRGPPPLGTAGVEIRTAIAFVKRRGAHARTRATLVLRGAIYIFKKWPQNKKKASPLRVGVCSPCLSSHVSNPTPLYSESSRMLLA